MGKQTGNLNRGLVVLTVPCKFTPFRLKVLVLLTLLCSTNVKWAVASSSHMSLGVINSEYNSRLDDGLELHHNNNIRPQEDESFLFNEIDEDVQCEFLFR